MNLKSVLVCGKRSTPSVKQTNACDTTRDTVFVNILPKGLAAATVEGIGQCAPFTVSLKNNSAGATRYKWMIVNEDGAPAAADAALFATPSRDTSREPRITFLKIGKYFIKLKIANPCVGSQLDWSSTVIEVKSKPILRFDPIVLTGSCTPQIVRLQAVLLSDGGLMTRIRWLPSGDTTLMPPPDTLRTSGSVIYTVLASNTCDTTRASQTVTLSERAVFNPNGDPSLRYTWRFGDGGTSTETSPSHTFLTAGNFTIRLMRGRSNKPPLT